MTTAPKTSTTKSTCSSAGKHLRFDLKRRLSYLHVSVFLLLLSYCPFQTLAMSSLSLVHPFFLGEALQSVPVLCLFFPSCITALGHVPGLFSGGLKFLLRGLPRFHVLFENVPDIFFLEPFLLQENFNFFAHPFEFSEAIGQFNILSLCPLYFDTSIPPLVSIFFLSFCWLSLYLLCHAAFLSLMCRPAPWKTSVMSFHQENFLASLVHCSCEL